MGAEAALSNSDLLPASRRPLPGDCGFQGCGPTSHPGHSFSRSSRVLTVHQAFCLALGTCGDQGPAGQDEGAGPAAQDPGSTTQLPPPGQPSPDRLYRRPLHNMGLNCKHPLRGRFFPRDILEIFLEICDNLKRL